MKVIIDADIPYAYELFSQFSDVTLLSGRDISFKFLRTADALIVRSVTQVNAELLDGTTVKFVGTTTSGVDHIEQSYLLRSSIFFSSASGCNAIAVSEYVFSALLWLANRDNFFLCDKTVGIIGYGNIGSYLHRILSILGVRTLLCDPILEKRNDNLMCFHSLERLVAEADILTFHVPLVYEQPYPTWHMVEKNVLDVLPSGRVLINTARGSVFDNVALLHVLEHKKHLCVVLDVWENEPKILFPLLKYIDLGTPHIAGFTLAGKIRGVMKIFNDFKIFFNIDTKDTQNLVLYSNIFSYCFEICEDINQDILFCLSSFIYNIRNDDINLRCNIGTSNYFDRLRRDYLYRKEWSSIYIKSPSKVYIDRFKNVGFNICS